MTIQTHVVWNRVMQPAELDLLEAKSAELTATGVTDGTKVMRNGTIDNNGDVVRIWTTADAANAWVAFVNTVTPPPVSATVIES